MLECAFSVAEHPRAVPYSRMLIHFYKQAQQPRPREFLLVNSLLGRSSDLAVIDQLDQVFADGIQRQEQIPIDVCSIFPSLGDACLITSLEAILVVA